MAMRLDGRANRSEKARERVAWSCAVAREKLDAQLMFGRARV